MHRMRRVATRLSLVRTAAGGVEMDEQVAIRDLDDGGRRAVNQAAALAEEQLKYAMLIARNVAHPGHDPDAALVAALVQAIATNFAAVR
jgi:hypothetical protein